MDYTKTRRNYVGECERDMV